MANKKFKDLVVAESGLRLPAETAQRALTVDASGDISSSAVTETELGYLSGTTSSVQDQLDDKALASDLSDHINDSADAHDASAILNVPAGNLAATDVQGALNELQSDVDSRALASDLSNHISDSSDAHDASAISNVPAGNLAATDVQAALNELQSDIDSRALDSAVIKKDGSVAFTADQSMGSFKLTNVANGTNSGDAVNKSQLDTKQDTSEKGAANGYASLDSSGKVPVSQLPNAIMEYQGVWNASTNSPSLADGVGNADEAIGNVYRVSVAGSQDLGSGSISFAVGDYAILNASKVWEKADTTDAVSSVNGFQGSVVLDAGDLNYTQVDPTDWTVADGSSIEATLDEVGQRLIDLENGGAATGEIKVSANDTTFGYIEDKIVGASGKISISTLNDGANEDLQITIGADVFDKAVDDSGDITEGSQLFFTDERAQDAVGTILVDSASIDFTYNDGTPSITAAVIPGGVDHDALSNFVANEHIDHSSVNINTAANSGLSGGGDITASRSLVIDPNNASLVTAALGDQVLIADASDSNALKKVTVQTIVDLAGAGSPGDIAETSFSIANNQATPANVTGLAFNNAVVRGFEVLATVEIDAASDLYETFSLYGIQKGASWDMSQESVGDSSGIVFSITSGGAIQYISQSYPSFVSGTIRFRARTTSI